MNYKLLILVGRSCLSVQGNNVLFAPYESPLAISLESRFDGYVWHHPDYKHHHETMGSQLSFAYAFNGYIKHENHFFSKMGMFFGAGTHHIKRVGIDLQFGKYGGALRFGFLNDGIGIGGDFWLIYKDRFKWLTTLELSASRDQQILSSHYFDRVHYYHDTEYKPFVKWLNRLFVYNRFYISFGIDHINCSNHSGRSLTQGFVGFGSTI